MWGELIVLCLTIAGSAGGMAWLPANRISGLEKGLTVRMSAVETEIHEMRADIRSINEFLRHNPAAN